MWIQEAYTKAKVGDLLVAPSIKLMKAYSGSKRYIKKTDNFVSDTQGLESRYFFSKDWEVEDLERLVKWIKNMYQFNRISVTKDDRTISFSDYGDAG